MSTETPPTTGVEIGVEDDDANQTLLAINGPGITGIVAIEHHTELSSVQDALWDLPREIEHLCHLNRWNHHYGGDDDAE